jgi:hypothetical protein
MGSFDVSIQLKSPPAGCGCAEPAGPPSAPRVEPPLFPAITLGPHQIDATSHSATFRFSSPIAGAAFICKLDGEAYRACASPFKVKGLKPGRHVFRVLATMGGTTSASPGVVHFTVHAPHRRHHRVG